MTPYELLTEEDKLKIATYCYNYAVSEGRTCQSSIGSVHDNLSYILRFWNENKNQYLLEAFGNQLIINYPISIEKPSKSIQDNMWNFIANGSGRAFRQAIIGRVYGIYNNYSSDQLVYVQNMFLDQNLVENKLKYHAFTFNLTYYNNEGESVTLTPGMKITKMLHKLAKLYNLEESYEQFRLGHSQVLNDRYITGDLCLSIHPLDYMTMSDNEYSWGSCMSWLEDGCYSGGTIEMMNSPCVVVAYLRGNSPMHLGNNLKWDGNKKWRQLFIVDPSIIVGIKSYPYQNTQLSSQILDLLYGLVTENLHWSKEDSIFFENLGGYDSNIDDTLYPMISDKRVRFIFDSEAMYNDFYTDNTKHDCYLWTKNITDTVRHYSDEYRFELCYSGPLNCMMCGDIFDYATESQKVCDDCAPSGIQCSCCGRYFEPEVEGDQIDDIWYCDACLEDETTEDAIMENRILNENAYDVFIAIEDDVLIPELINSEVYPTFTTHIDYCGYRPVAALPNYTREYLFTDVFFQENNYRLRYNDTLDLTYINLSDLTNYGVRHFIGSTYNVNSATEYYYRMKELLLVESED